MVGCWCRLLSALVVLLVVVGCATPAVLPAVSSVQIADGERSVAVGSTLALSVTVESIGGAS